MKLAPNDVEAAVAAVCVIAAILFPVAGKALFLRIRDLLRPLESRPGLTIALIVLLPVALRFAVLPWDPPPLARTMEENNHLWQAATYVEGRVANPPHPLAVVFNEFQIVEWPHRVSARPPVCPLFFWLGDVLFHSAWLGNVASVALAAGLIYWMLLGWTRPSWAILGALLIDIRYCVYGYWMDSFWGATVPLIGGILVLGVAPRIRKGPKLWHAAVFSIGLVLLAGSRPFEGALLMIPVGLYLVAGLFGGEETMAVAPALRNFIAPLAAALVLIIGAQLKYDQITTGKATLMPYQVWRNQQTTVPAFVWQPLSSRRLVFYYPEARTFQKWEEEVSHRFDPPRRQVAQFASRHVYTLRDALGPLMLLPFLCWSAVWFSRSPSPRALKVLAAISVAAFLGFSISEHRIAGLLLCIPVALIAGLAIAFHWRSFKKSLPVAVVIAAVVATSITSFYMGNYLLPFICGFLVLIVFGLRNLAAWDRRRGTGAALAGFLIAGSVFMLAGESAMFIAGLPLYDRSDLGRYDFPPFTGFHDAVRQLNRMPGKHLVFARYGNNYLTTNEYVWNGPDIDQQKIVWARDLRPEWTAAAVQYYKGRQVWLLDKPDERGPVLEPYPVKKLPAPGPLSQLPIPYRDDSDANPRVALK